MRVLHYFNWTYSYLSHALAIKLQEKYDVNHSSGLVIGREVYEFLKNQNDIDYEHLALVQDIFNDYQNETVDHEYLSYIEKKYGIPNLWPYIYADRDIILYNKYSEYTYEDNLKILQIFFKNIEELIENARPDYVIFTVIASMPSYILYNMAQKKGIKTILFTIARVGNRIILDDGIDNFGKVDNVYKKIKEGYNSPHKREALNYLQEFRKGQQKSGYFTLLYIQQLKNKNILQVFKRTSRIFHYFYQTKIGYYKNDYKFKNKTTIRAIQEEIKRIINRKRVQNDKLYAKPDLDDKYIFFPLHLEPEMATMIKAPFYINQLALIENIAKSLPIGLKLYVKDHPSMVLSGGRSISYYKKLQEIPNLKLVHPSIDSYELIKNSQLVATITGTVGFEALLLKKPVITFGDVFYNKMSMVTECENIEGLPHIVQQLTTSYQHDEKELINYLTAIFESSIDINYYELLFSKSLEEVFKHEGLDVLVEKIAEEIEAKA